jgi:hypothetical protein
MIAAHTNPAGTVPPAIAAGAEGAVAYLFDVMDRLLATIEQETALVRAGRLSEAAPLERAKTDLGQQYLAAVARIRTGHTDLAETAPALYEELRRRHDLFQALLQINLTVLATAHAVSEGIMRGVSGELARKAAPSTYGATGRANAPGPSAAQPLAVSRVL